jgi:F-type H+-transporting ATPase subunit c
MRKILFMVLLVVILTMAAPVYAQGTGAAPASNWSVPIGVGLGMGLAAGLAGLGQGKVAASVAEALARNPGARAGIQQALFIGLAFIESLVLFTFLLLLLKA